MIIFWVWMVLLSILAVLGEMMASMVKQPSTIVTDSIRDHQKVMMGSENLKSKERSINTDVFDNDNVDLSLSADNNPFKETLVKNNIGGNNIRLLTTDTPAVQPTGQPIMVSKFYLCT